MTSSDPSIARLQAAVLDGRTANIRYRQDQFQKLFKAFSENADTLADAMAKDTSATAAEVEVELFLTLDSVRHFYDGLNFERELKEEYSLKNGEDNEGRRIGIGIVLVRPTIHTRLYSVLTPTCAAIAAGNCVLLELPQTTLQIDNHLRSLLPQALDTDTFTILSSPPSASDLSTLFLVDQTSVSPPPFPPSNELLSPTQSRTICIVDRTCSYLQSAAESIVSARFDFQGTSPYAPDLVIVNEFVKKEFFEAVIGSATKLFAGREGGGKGRGAGPGPGQIRVGRLIRELEEKGSVESFGSNEFKVLDILDRSCALANMKISGYYLHILSCSSITDAVFSQDPKTSFLAGYFFAAPAAAKFMSQHLNCQLTYVNQIPAHLLVGPASPFSHIPFLHPRYTSTQFSLPRPQYITSPPSSLSPVSQILTFNKDSKISSKDLRKLSLAPLKPTGQAPGKAVGFFEHGIITGASLLFGVVVPVTLAGTWLAVRKGVEVWRR